MAKYSNTIEYNLRTTLDQSGLTQLHNQIRLVENELRTLQQQKLISKKSSSEALATINEVKIALQNAFNPKLGLLDNKALISNLSKVKGGINGVYQAFAAGGSKGVQAFSQFYGQLTKVDQGLKQVSSTSDKIFNTLGNTVRWGLIASAFAHVMNSARESVEYVKELDESLTNIMMVTDYSREAMNEYAKSANEAAKALGSTTTAMTNATLVFAQQGYDLGTSSRLATTSTQLANISQQDTATASDEITAYKNAFNLKSIDEINNAMSKWAIVANVSAADVEELSVASQKAASTAVTVGVNMDQLAAQIAAIETVTREAPENIGNGLKTLYARFSDIGMGETLEDGVDLGKVTGVLQKVGVQVLDAEGNMRQVGDIMEDLMEVWGDLDLTQRSSVATTLAGKFQLSRFTSLMNRSDLYKQYLGASESETGTGTFDEMQEKFADSMTGRMNKLQATIESVFNQAFASDSFYPMIDAVTQLIQLFSDLTDAIGGGGTALTAFAAIATRAFSNQIGTGIGNIIYNRQQRQQYGASKQAAQNEAIRQLKGQGLTVGDARTQQAANDIAGAMQYRTLMNAEAEEQFNTLVQERVKILQAESEIRAEIEAQVKAIDLIAKAAEGETTKNEQEALNYLREQLQLGSDVIDSESLRNSNLGKITANLEQQETILSKIANQANNQAVGGLINSLGKVTTKETGTITLKDYAKELKSIDLSAQAKERLAKSTEVLTKLENGEKVSIEEVSTAFEKYRQEIRETEVRLLNLLEDIKISKASFEELTNKEKALEIQTDSNSKAFAGLQSQMKTINMATSITNLASGAMTGIFALQSLHGILETIEDDSLNLGQKFEQVAMNLTMLAAMGIPAVTQLREAWTGITTALREWQSVQLASIVVQEARNAGLSEEIVKDLEAAGAEGALGREKAKNILIQHGMNEATAEAIVANMELAAAEEIETKAAGKSAIAKVTQITVGEAFAAVLGKEIEGVIGLELASAPLLPILAALAITLGVVTAGVKAASDQQEREKKNLEDMVQASNQAVSAIKENKTNVDSLFESYQKTGTVSDEFKNALLQQAEALGVVNAEQLISIGQYSKLKEEIDEATQKQLDYNTALLQASQQKNIQKAQGTWDKYDVTQVTGGNVSGGLTAGAAEKAGIIFNYAESMPLIEQLPGLISDEERAQRILKIRDAYQEQTKTIGQLNKELADLIKNQASEAEIRAKQDEITRETNYQKEYQNVLSNEGAQAWLENYDKIIENQKAIALADKDFLSSVSDIDSIKQVLESGQLGSEITEYFRNLTPEAAQEFLNGFASEIADAKNDEVLKAAVEQAVAQSLDIDALSSYVSSAYSQEKIEQILKDAGLDASQLGSYVENFKQAGGAGVIDDDLSINHETVLEAIEGRKRFIATLKEQQKAWQDESRAEVQAAKANDTWDKTNESLAKQIAETTATTDALEKSVENMALRCMETNTGLKELADNWEIINQGMESDDIATQTQALTQLDSAVSKILNIEPGSLNEAFYTDPHNLELIQELVSGNLDVLDEFRARGAEGIIVNMEFNGDNAEQLRQEALAAVSLAEAELPDIEVGAYLENGQFIDALNQLAAEGGYTVSQLNEMFGGMGIEIEPIPVDLPFQGVAVEAAGVIDRIGSAFGLNFHAAETVNARMTGFRVKKLGGGGGGSGYHAPSSGGSGGGGGGGGGGKEESPKNVGHQDAGDSELDIYKKIDSWLEKLQDDYSRLKKIRDRTWSKDSLKAANQELDLLRSQYKALQDKLDIAQEYRQALLGDENLKRKYNVKNSLNEYGLTDNDLDGVVDNYAQQWRVAKDLADKAQKEADDYFRSHGGETGKDQYGNIVVIKDAQMYEEEENHYKELTETAKNALSVVNQINEVTDTYQDTSDTIRDTQEEQLDILQEIEDIQIELYQTSIKSLETLKDIHDTMKQMQGMWSGFELDSPFRAMVEDVREIEDFFSGESQKEVQDYYDNILTTIDQRADLTKAEQQQAKDFFQRERSNALSAQGYNNLGFGEFAAATRRLAELQEMESNEAVRKLVYGTNTKQWQEDFEEQAKKVQELALDVEQAWEKAEENVVKALDEEAEKLNELYDKYERISSGLERESERISLLYGEDQYADLNKIADKQGKVDLEKSKKYYQEYNYWKTKQDALAEAEEKERNLRINEARLAIQRASNAQEKAEAELRLEQAKQYHSDEWEWYEERMTEALENTKDAQDAAAEAFKKAYEYMIDELEAKWLESALGTRDSNYLLDDWNRDKDYMTTYKDDFERQYEVQKLNYKWQQMLNDSLGSSLVIQRKIKTEGQEILDQLAGQATMSEYDVKLANAKLEVLQKQIALENAQQNKSQMKLRRDSQGNYKYVYAADQDDINGKQQELLDSIYDVWEISKGQSIDSTTNYIEAVQQAGEQAKAIWNDASLTIEQKQALIAELMADTGRLLEAISEDAGDSFDGMISAVVFGSGIGLENVQEMCANVLEALQTHNEEAIEAIGVPWDNELQSKMESINEVEQAFATMMQNCASSNQYFLDEIQNPTTGVAAVMGEAYGSATDAINTATDATNNLYNETLKLYTLFGVESSALDQAKKTLIEYRDLLNAATSGSGALAEQIQKANQQIVDNAKASQNWITNANKIATTAEGTANAHAISVVKVSSQVIAGATASGGGGGGGGISRSGGGGGGSGSLGGSSGVSVPSSRTSNNNTNNNNSRPAEAEWQNIWFVGSSYNGVYATGGYTGSWSDNGVDEKNGKWAILHQKELVLNAADTVNILAAVDMVRNMTDTLKTASLANVREDFKKARINNSGDTIEQRVEITAEFPNANSASEIKQALLGLSDSAMQYAYRER